MPFFLFLFLLAIVSGLTTTLLLWVFRPNQAIVASELSINSHEITLEDQHNAFTDLVFWKGSFFLVYISSPSHFANQKSSVMVLTSSDFENWEEVICLKVEGKDIRDPKIACIKDSLFIYALLNDSIDPKPNGTVYSRSVNGKDWTPFTSIAEHGWLFGHPKSIDNEVWYTPAHNWTFDQLSLLRSTDGVNWQICSIIADQKGLDETAIEWVNNDKLIAVTRFEPSSALFGSKKNGTLVHTSKFPFDDWELMAEDHDLRLDSPSLFIHNQQVYVVARYQIPQKGILLKQGSIFSRKRTSIFAIETNRILHLSDLRVQVILPIQGWSVEKSNCLLLITAAL